MNLNHDVLINIGRHVGIGCERGKWACLATFRLVCKAFYFAVTEQQLLLAFQEDIARFPRLCISAGHLECKHYVLLQHPSSQECKMLPKMTETCRTNAVFKFDRQLFSNYAAIVNIYTVDFAREVFTLIRRGKNALELDPIPASLYPSTRDNIETMRLLVEFFNQAEKYVGGLNLVTLLSAFNASYSRYFLINFI